MQKNSSEISVDIFCRVIDNYGDAGVMWRLARALRADNYRVRLIIDEPNTLRSLAGSPENCPVEKIGESENIGVYLWEKSWAEGTCPLEPAQAVIEGFACRLPPDYEKKMTRRAPKWFNIDYFSAEDWIEGCHLMPSIDPATGLVKTNYFPGVTSKSGSLIFENDYEEKKTQWLNLHCEKHEALKILFFAYPYGPIEALAHAFSEIHRPIELMLTPCEASRLLAQALTAHSEGITLKSLPFVAQKDFDTLLWDCDIAFIRGEDSAARAMLAGVPFLWHIYHQDDNVHMVKLKALEERFRVYFDDSSVFERWCSVQESMNQGAFPVTDFLRLLNDYDQWKSACEKFSRHLRSLGSLAEKLSELIKNG